MSRKPLEAEQFARAIIETVKDWIGQKSGQRAKHRLRPQGSMRYFKRVLTILKSLSPGHS